jgi:hypothetical protein
MLPWQSNSAREPPLWVTTPSETSYVRRGQRCNPPSYFRGRFRYSIVKRNLFVVGRHRGNRRLAEGMRALAAFGSLAAIQFGFRSRPLLERLTLEPVRGRTPGLQRLLGKARSRPQAEVPSVRMDRRCATQSGSSPKVSKSLQRARVVRGLIREGCGLSSFARNKPLFAGPKARWHAH